MDKFGYFHVSFVSPIPPPPPCKSSSKFSFLCLRNHKKKHNENDIKNYNNNKINDNVILDKCETWFIFFVWNLRIIIMKTYRNNKNNNINNKMQLWSIVICVIVLIALTLLHHLSHTLEIVCFIINLGDHIAPPHKKLHIHTQPTI